MRISDWSSDVCSSDLVRDDGKAGRQDFGSLHAPDLCGRTHGDIEDEMSRSGGDFLGEHRGYELALGVAIERALDADEDIVCWAKRDSATPDDAAGFSRDHLADGPHGEVDGSEGLHRIRRGRRRGGCLCRRLW